MNKRFFILALLVAFAALLRFVPHPLNVSPVVAIALFGGACFANKKTAYGIPLLAMLLSDLLLIASNQVSASESLQTQPWVYGCLLFATWLGQKLPAKRNALHVACGVLAGSLAFFLITNFACFILGQDNSGLPYSKDWSGLAQCFTAAIPFFRNSLMGDLGFSALLFGSLFLVEKGMPAVRQFTPYVKVEK